MRLWYFQRNGQRIGPISGLEVLRLWAEGELSEQTVVWPEGAEWRSRPLEMWLTSLRIEASEVLPPIDLPQCAGGAEASAPREHVSAAGAFPPTSADPGQAAASAPQKALRIEFRGTTREYFRIWLVNVALTLLTAGIYLAWAKVRTRRYFYANTLLAGRPFEFTGNPVAILKGNLIFGLLFTLYSLCGHFYPKAAVLVLLAIYSCFPWLLCRAMAFRARNSFYRNVRFSFSGRTAEAFKAFLGLPLLVPLTLGYLAPEVIRRQQQFLLGHISWGKCQAQMQGERRFYRGLLFKVIGGFMLCCVVLFLCVIGDGMSAARAMRTRSAPSAAKVEKVEKVEKVGQGRVRSPQPAANDPARAKGGEPKIKGNKSAEMQPTDGKAKESKAKESRDSALARDGRASGNRSSRTILRQQSSLLLVVVISYLTTFYLVVFYRVRLRNYSVSQTYWPGVGRLQMCLSSLKVFWIYVGNGVCIAASFGLLIPWARVRMARYEAQCCCFLAECDFEGSDTPEDVGPSALGESAADVFDFEIGI